MEIFKVAVLINVMSIVSSEVGISDDLFKKCFPHTKMCDVDAASCFMTNGPLVTTPVSLISECEIYQNSVYRSDKRRKFNISIHPSDLDLYPPNISYSVYRVKAARTSSDYIWDQQLIPVEGCCDMTLSKSCFLPRYEKEQGFVVILPQATKRSDRPWYCAWLVTETNGFLDTCEEGKRIEKTCWNFTNGHLYARRTIFSSLTTRLTPETADYCFFSAPKKISNLVSHNETKAFKRSEHFPDLEVDKDCQTVIGEDNNKMNTSELVARHTDISLEGVVCFQFRVPAFNHEDWQGEVQCFRPEFTTRDCENKDKYFYATLGSIVLLMAIFMFMMGYCFRRYVMKKIEKSIPSTFIVAKTSYFNENAPHDDSSSKEEPFPIEVYFPMEGLSDDNEDFPTKLDSIENNQIWSSNDVSVSLAEEGIYCKKFDMHSYVKVKHEIESA